MTSGMPSPRPAIGAVRADQLLLGRVGDEVAGGLAGVHVQAGDAPRVVVVEHQPRALLVRVVEGLAAVVAAEQSGTPAVADHVGHVLDADALRPRGGLVGGRDPLVRGAVADPRGDAAVQVQRGPVVREAVVLPFGVLGAHRVADVVRDGAFVDRRRPSCHRAHAGAHQRRVRREEQVAVCARRQQVVEDDADRLVLRRDDRRAEVVRVVDAASPGTPSGMSDGVERAVKQRRSTSGDVLADASVGRRLELHVLAERACPRRQSDELHLLAVLDDGDHVVVRVPGERRRVGTRDRDVLAEVVRPRPGARPGSVSTNFLMPPAVR